MFRMHLAYQHTLTLVPIERLLCCSEVGANLVISNRVPSIESFLVAQW